MNERQRVLGILNSMDIIESNGGEESYALVEVNDDSKDMLKEAGVPLETALKYGDDENFCIVALAFSEGYANWWTSKELLYLDDRTTKAIKREIQLVLDSSHDSLNDLHQDVQSTLNNF